MRSGVNWFIPVPQLSVTLIKQHFSRCKLLIDHMMLFSKGKVYKSSLFHVVKLLLHWHPLQNGLLSPSLCTADVTLFRLSCWLAFNSEFRIHFYCQLQHVGICISGFGSIPFSTTLLGAVSLSKRGVSDWNDWRRGETLSLRSTHSRSSRLGFSVCSSVETALAKN